MSAANFAQEIVEYAEFRASKRGQPLSYEELNDIRKAAYHAFSTSEGRVGRAKIDGLEAVPWIKKFREEMGCSLREAKDAWDVRVAKAKAAA